MPDLDNDDFASMPLAEVSPKTHPCHFELEFYEMALANVGNGSSNEIRVCRKSIIGRLNLSDQKQSIQDALQVQRFSKLAEYRYLLAVPLAFAWTKFHGILRYEVYLSRRNVLMRPN